MPQADVQQKFAAALDALVAQIKEDRSILAAILCGSLSHDTVWEGSDIDLLLVTVDDRKIASSGRALSADGVNVHAQLMPRAEFRKTVEGAIRQSFIHALIAKGRLLYTHDPTIADLCARLGEIGGRDRDLQILGSATGALAMIYKARKWLLTRGDLEYAALFILYAAWALARVEVMRAGRIADREVIPQALELNPPLFKTIYTDLLNTKKTAASVNGALAAIDRYFADRAKALFAPVVEHLRDAGEARSATDIDDHFARNCGVEGVSAACEYLADLGLIGKASMPIKLTPKSTIQVEELAFFHIAARRERHGR